MNWADMRPSTNILDCRGAGLVGLPDMPLSAYLTTLGWLAFYAILLFAAAHLLLSLYERLSKTRGR